MILFSPLLFMTLAYANNIIGNHQTNDSSSINLAKTDAHSAHSEESLKLINEYQQKICNHSNTCSMLDQVPAPYRDLRTRDCMCDEKCSLYGDCCTDSIYFHSNQSSKDTFSCVETATNGYVYMKTSCPASYNKTSAILTYCETTDPMLLALDVWITTPVTDSLTRITYRNMFCAFCHGVDDFDFWQVGLTCSPKEPSLVIDESILPELKLNDSESPFWQYLDPQNKTYSCLYHAKVLTDHDLRYCVPSVDTCSANWTASSNCSSYTSYTYVNGKAYKNPDCLACNHISQSPSCSRPPARQLESPLTVDILNKDIQKIPRCEEIPSNVSVFERICPTEKPAAAKEMTECARTSKCLIDGYFDIASDIDILDNVTVYIKSRDMQFNESEYYKMPDNKSIYICGHEIPRTFIQQIYDTVDDWVSEILIKLSIICLVLHLLIFQQLPEMKNLSGKNLAVFCLWLLLALLGFEIGPRLPRCEIVAVILHYSLLSCFTWMLIMSYDCWLSLYRATKKFRAAGGKHANKFLLYCLLSTVVPLAVISVSLYFELSPPSIVPCEHKLGYGKYKQCFISQKFGFITFFIIPASSMFFCNVCFFAHTAYMIFLSQRTTVNPNTRNDFKLYTRLALMMGLTWTLGTLLFVTDAMLVGLLFSVLNMSQGIFIFFGFTFKQKTLKQLLNKHKNNPKVSTFLSTFVQEYNSDTTTQQTQLDNVRT